MKRTIKFTILIALMIMALSLNYIGAEEQKKEENQATTAKTEEKAIQSGGCCSSEAAQEKGVKGDEASCPMGKECKGKDCNKEGCPYHAADVKPANPQTTCPIMGGNIDKKYSAEYEGKRVYFCCESCVSTFKKSPEKYVKQLEDQGIDLEKATKPQTQCPISGKKINKNFASEHMGKKVYFCGPGCQKEFGKNPMKYMKSMKEQGIEPEKIVKAQETCPVMGGKITKEHFADYNGKRVFFCCASCTDTFKKDPEKYLKKLGDLGETPEELK